MVEQLAQGRRGLAPAGVFPVYPVEGLEHQQGEGGEVEHPGRLQSREGQVIVTRCHGRETHGSDANNGQNVGGHCLE